MNRLATLLECEGTASLHDAPIKAIAYSADGRRLATADGDMRLCLSEEGRVAHSVDLSGNHPRGRAVDRMREIAFSPDGERVYAAAGRYIISVSADTGHVLWRYQAPNFLCFLVNSPTALAVSDLGEVFVSFEDGLIERFDPFGRKLKRRRDNDAPVHMAFLADGRTLVGCDPFTLTVWEDYATRKVWNARTGLHVLGFAANPRTSRVALRTAEAVEVHDVQEGTRVGAFPIGTGLPLVLWHPNRDLLATAGVDRVVLRDAGGESWAEAHTPGRRVTAIAFDPSGERLVVGGRDGVVRSFRLA